MSSDERRDAPRATYRIQLNPSFTFDDVAGIADYLADLGITHVYCSPYLQAAPGSTHGYDVEDHSRLNGELGGREGFERMVAALEEHGLNHIVDIVPNHVSVAGAGNTRWWDVLKHGRSSPYAPYFDIEWERVPADLAGKVLVPILGDETDKVIERGEISLVLRDGEAEVQYYENRLPLAPGSIPQEGLGDVVSRVNDDPSALKDLLEKQHYLLSFWRRARRHLNYRRFFDINTLAALRMEEPGVFEETHALTLELIREGKLDGLRVDHIDGLSDPGAYLTRLKEDADVYLVVEKILEPGEELPASWPVEGTTGYDFMNVVGGLYVDPRAEERMRQIYENFIGEQVDLDQMTLEKKYLLMRHVMVSDMNRLTNELEELFEKEGWESTPNLDDHLMNALGEVIASFHVYRTYISPTGERSESDERIIRHAVADARERRPFIDEAIFDRLESVLLMEAGGEHGRAFALRFQQMTGPIMAKSLEDTVFYNFNRLVSLNEVGGNPGVFGVDVEHFHAAARRAQEMWQLSMLATSTHDTKRGEDVRTRISALAEIPDEWAAATTRWAKIAERHRTGELPDLNAIYLFFQTVVGAWPLGADRAVEYMQKAAKEAKRYTSWIDPVRDYDDALERLVRGLLGDDEFTSDVEALVASLLEPARRSSLGQTLIRLTYPGVPDTYQGTEDWALTLVDPDNRRPVDYPARRELLQRALATPAADLWRDADDGAAKMSVMTEALAARRLFPRAFGSEGTYEPLIAQGPGSDRVVAFVRGGEVAVVTTRLNVGLDDVLPGTSIELPEGSWQEVFSEKDYSPGSVEVAGLLAGFPVALLLRG